MSTSAGQTTEPDNFRIVASSAGFHVGSAGNVTLNGTRVAVSGGYRRGITVVVFKETAGTVVEGYYYDTYSKPDDSNAFADMIESLPVGRVVAIVVVDEATSNLTERAKNACELIFTRAHGRSSASVARRRVPWRNDSTTMRRWKSTSPSRHSP